jgi:uncharacterized protein
MDDALDISDRLAARTRPDGWPLMYQSWGNLLFMHWRIPVQELRPHIPEPLEIDTFDGSAWIAITPLALWNVRPIFVPPLPFVSEFLEINVRTYVYYENVPGVWFFSLDANSWLSVTGARLFYLLPYYTAEIDLARVDRTTDFRSERQERKGGSFSARWTITKENLETSTPGSLEFFLTERYCLYTANDSDIYRCRIHHQPWKLGAATVESFETGLFAANELSTPSGSPLLHATAPLDVEVWGLERITKVDK